MGHYKQGLAEAQGRMEFHLHREAGMIGGMGEMYMQSGARHLVDLGDRHHPGCTLLQEDWLPRQEEVLRRVSLGPGHLPAMLMVVEARDTA